MSDPISESYSVRAAAYAARASEHERRARSLSHARLLAFALLVAAGVWAEEGSSSIALPVVAALVVVFAVLVGRHRKQRAAQRWHEELSAVSEEGIARRARAWSTLPTVPAPGDVAHHPFAGDIDVFGRASIAQLLGPAGTPFGTRRLRAWLLDPAATTEIVQRQQAVRALAPQHEWRAAIAVHARRTKVVSEAELRAFADWTQSPDWLLSRPLLLWCARLLPFVTFGLMAAQLAGVIQGLWWLLGVAAAAALTFGPGRRIHEEYRRAFAREGMLRNYPDLLRTAAELPGDAPLLEELRATLGQGARAPHAALARLERLMNLADLRYSGSMHLPVQLLTLWDFHVLARLERWKRETGNVPAWLEALGTVEALSALATLAHDQPDWTYPQISAEHDAVSASALGHPLLRDDDRVTNDVSVGPPGTFLLVTGSNMSGKSTLLRAIGVNVVLAQAGAPVCAAHMTMPPCDLFTSVRISDSLAEGVSLFLAELQRVRDIVRAGEQHAGSERKLLYLLDEMLHGTNTAERRVAARTVIRHLLKTGAIGAVTTHDLTLADDPSLRDLAQRVHFTEHVERGPDGVQMTFDYVLRPGLATSTNALALMEIVGLRVEE